MSHSRFREPARGSIRNPVHSAFGDARLRANLTKPTLPPRRLHWRLVAIALVGFLVGCASHSDRVVKARQQFYAGQLDLANESIVTTLEKAPKDAEVLKLDQALVRLSQGEAREAESLLLEVRDEFDHLEQKNLAEDVLSYLTDETERAYSGEPYERVLIRVFLALANLLDDGADVEAYSLQVQDEQQKILETYGEQAEEIAPQFQVAIAPYLRGVLAESTHHRYDDAARDYAQVVAWQPTFDAGRADLDRVQNGRHSERGNGVVYVIAFVGKGPYKKSVAETPTTAALLVADQILSATGKHTLPPTIAPIKVPRVVRAPNNIDRLLVQINNEAAGHTTTVTDVTAMAIAQNNAEIDGIVGRAVARRVVKKAIVYTAKDAASVTNNSFVNFAMDAAGVLWEATETADTRCWGLLPDSIQVKRIELPVGQHQLGLQPASGTGPKGELQTLAVEVVDGRNTYVLANFPGVNPTGQIQTVTH